MTRFLSLLHPLFCLAAITSLMGLSTKAIAQTPDNPITGVTIKVSSGCANVRKTPSINGELVTCLTNGQPLKPVIGEQNGWLLLQSGNWVQKQFTSLAGTPTPSPQESASEPRGMTTERLLLYIPNNPMRGDDVERLQRKLNEHRVLATPIVVDGIFGAGTKKAVEALQKRHNLTVDGIAGPDVFKILNL